jgi:hypothetical protein
MTVPQAHLLLAEETAFSFAKHCPSLLAATRYGVRFDPLDPIALVRSRSKTHDPGHTQEPF